MKLVHVLVNSIFLYACESWTLTVELQRKIAAVDLRCFRRILGISYTDHVTNEETRKTIAQHVGHCEDLLTSVKKKKLRWYGHVTRSSGLFKIILQGKRRQGTQRKRWTNNIEGWTGKTFAETQALAHNTKTGADLCNVHWSSAPTTQAGYRISNSKIVL